MFSCFGYFQVDFSDLQNITLREKNDKKKKSLRRSRYEGVFVDVSLSASTTCLKASINGVQVRHLEVDPWCYLA